MPDIRRMIMTQQATAMVLASFVADSLALGAHWMYDTDEIDRRIGRVEGLRKPMPNSYHPTKGKGDFTHYGDQTLALLEYLVKVKEFVLADFAVAWKTLFTSYHGYIDKATATTLENMNRHMPVEQCGSHSSELAGVARIAPLLFFYKDDREKLFAAVRQQTALTHNNSATLAGAEFIAKTALSVLQGGSPVAAIENALDQGVSDIDLDIRLRAGLDSVGKDTKMVIKKFGQMCGVAAALPGVIHLIATYENDLETALIENVMAGGDSGARGMVVGMILGPYLGVQAIPKEWLADMVQYAHIMALLSSKENAK
jgi:ADP-ribosylglycohydrolase